LKDKKKEVDEQTFQTLNSLQALLVYEPVSLLISYEQLTKMAGFDVRDTNGVVYRGQYNSQGEKEGLGIQTKGERQVYEGEWKKGVRHGNGYEVFKSGNTYKGEYSEGKVHGEGIYKWKDGQTYDGTWKQG